VQVICCLLRTTPKFMWNIWCSNLSILQTTTRNGICEYSPALILPEYILLHSMTFMREDRFVGLCAFILGQLKMNHVSNSRKEASCSIICTRKPHSWSKEDIAGKSPSKSGRSMSSLLQMPGFCVQMILRVGSFSFCY
jgi:hypothetical protein